MGIPASQRLRRQSDFQQVRRVGHRTHCGPFVIQCEPGAQGSTMPPMLGVIASRRVGNAVKRNRGKRLVREIFRANAGRLAPGSRIVVVLRAAFDRYNYAELETQFIKACDKMAMRSEPGRQVK